MTATATWTQRAPQPGPATHPHDDADSTDLLAADEVTRSVVLLTRTLAGLPSHESLLQALVLGLPARFGVCSALLARCEGDGAVLVTGSYGLPGLDDPAELVPAAYEDLVLRALRSEEPCIRATQDELLVQLPHDAGPHAAPQACAAVRLEHHGVPVGAVVLGMDHDVEDVDQLRRLLAVTGAMVGAHLGLLARVPAPRAARPRPRAAEDVHLTRRQLAVLGLMAEGMSNRQISMRVGYSESTVRHETMAIYRALGVGDRRTASLLALELGLVG